MATGKKSLKDLLNSAKLFIHGILGMHTAASLTEENIQAIIDKAYKIADIFHTGKMDPAIEETAKSFLHGLLAKQHVLNLSDEQIQELVDKAVALATSFHNKKE